MDVVILDNEAVNVLLNGGPKRARINAFFDATHRAKRKRSPDRRLIVPTTVRAEARWDRRAAGAAYIDRLSISDSPLDADAANAAAAIAADCDVSPADAHIGVVARAYAGHNVTVLTSDPADISCAVAGTATTVRI